MMNRRDFVRRLVAGLAGTAVATELDLERLLWVPKPMIVVPAMPGPTSLQIDWITKEACRLLEKRLASLDLMKRQYDLIDVSAIGNGGITDQSHVGVELSPKFPPADLSRVVLAPAMAALADHVADKGFTSFGTPALLDYPHAVSSAVVVSKKTGVAIRGAIGAFIDEFGVVEDVLRFDVLTGGRK